MKKIIPAGSTLIPEHAERVFEGKIFDVYHWDQEQFNGQTKTFEGLLRPDTVVAVCIVEDKLLVVNDTQPHKGSRMGLPGGRVDYGETTLEAVQREILEETGFRFGDWRLVEVTKPLSKTDWFFYVYVAQNVTDKTEPNYDDGGEIISAELLDYDKALSVLTESSFEPDIMFLKDCGSLEAIKNSVEFGGVEVDTIQKRELS